MSVKKFLVGNPPASNFAFNAPKNCIMNKKLQIAFSIQIYSYSEMPIENESFI